jgi:hypothetical protein
MTVHVKWDEKKTFAACVRRLCVMSEMSECQEITGKAGTGGSALARALAGANVPGAYAAALEAGGCGWEALASVWAAAEAEAEECEEDVCACVGAVRDVTWAAGHRAVFERVKRCAGVGAWAGLEMYPWRVANAVAARCLRRANG